MAKRSLTASPDGLTKAREALNEKGLTQEKAGDNASVSRSTIMKFFTGKPVARLTFVQICESLNLNWKEIVDLEQNGDPKLEILASDEPAIDVLVQDARRRCISRIEDLHGKIQLIDGTEIEVARLYVDVYVLEEVSSRTPFSMSYLLELFKKSQASQTDIENLLETFQERKDFARLGLESRRGERQKGFKIAQERSRLMVLGKPGSGKTTFLKHLAIACSKQEFQPERIPVFIKLREIDGSNFNLLKHIHQELEAVKVEHTEKLLSMGRLLILIDGLDEVSSQYQRLVQNKICDFSRNYRQNHFIVTCRTQVANKLQDFYFIEVADFSSQQVETFAENWFLVTNPKEGRKQHTLFMKKLRKSQTVAELAVTPILLNLTCFVFSREQMLPSKRSELYEQGLNQLLKEWDVTRGIERGLQSETNPKLSLRQKQHLLSELAVYKFEQPQNYILFKEDEIINRISNYLGFTSEDSEIVLETLESQHGLLIEQAQQIWSFSHLSFQEYFVAKYIVLSDQDWQKLSCHLAEAHWYEVILLVAEMLPSTESLLRHMKQYADQLVSTETEIQRFLVWTSNKANQIKIPHKPAALRAFYFALDRTLNRNRAPEQGYNNLLYMANFLTFSSNREAYCFNKVSLEFFLNKIFDLASTLDCTIDHKRIDYDENFDCVRCEAIKNARIFVDRVDKTRARDRARIFVFNLIGSLNNNHSPISTSYTKNIYKIFHYLYLVLPRVLDSNLVNQILDKFSSYNIINTSITQAYTHKLELRNLALDLAHAYGFDRSYDFDLTLSWILEFALACNFNVSHSYSKFYRDSMLPKTWMLRVLKEAIDTAPTTELEVELQELRKELPSGNDSGFFRDWWQVKGKNWTERLRLLMIKYRDVGYDFSHWNFSLSQDELLKRYYYINQLLVDCLSFAKDSPNLQEIEETMFLPIAKSDC